MPALNVAKIFDPSAREHRVRYVIRTILRSTVTSEAAFRNCLELEDGEEVIRAVLRRGLRNRQLHDALLSSRLITLDKWLRDNPAFVEAYYFPEESGDIGVPGRKSKKQAARAGP